MEKQTPFGSPNHEVPSYLEKVQSQLPALQLLIQMGWEYLKPEETVNLRGGRMGSAILDPILLDHIRVTVVSSTFCLRAGTSITCNVLSSNAFRRGHSFCS